ncbi:MAG: thioether cross-link-forming SCIFF peptide maturase [Oscillospiraceae bacterium]|nr:thioether cross-link-forming SCIFF peptide maturase [Oscillospiraceae bacterium]
MPDYYKFTQGGLFILLDVCSGGVYVLDEETYNLPFDSPELAGILSNVEDNYDEYAVLNVDAPLKAMCLQVSHDCNMRCVYCFAEGLLQENGGGKSLMSCETAKKAVDFLISGSGGRDFLEIDFFGGEPLLAWGTVKETVEYAKEQAKIHGKEFRFTITTNGLLLDDEKIAYINEEMSNVVLSLDGRREVNDKMRPCMNGKGSYDVVLPKFKKLVDSRIKQNRQDRADYFVRGTFTRCNLGFSDDVLAIAGEGFRNISIEPVTGTEDLPFALHHEHLPRIKNEYDRLFEIVRKNGNQWNFFHFTVDLENGPCILKRLRGCGAGNEYIAVAPDGNIFPCHRYVGIDEWKMGNIRMSDSLNLPIKEYFSKTHIYTKEKCSKCWARFYCGGGCNAESFVFEGDARKPSEFFCELMKKRTECAIALAAVKQLAADN